MPVGDIHVASNRQQRPVVAAVGTHAGRAATVAVDNIEIADLECVSVVAKVDDDIACDTRDRRPLCW